MVAEVLTAVVVAQGEPRGDAGRVAPVVLPQPLAQRLQRLEARAGSRRVNADTLLRAVVDGDEDRGVALAGGEARGGVGSLHLVGTLGADRAVVVARPAAAPDPGRGEQTRFPHQPQHPALRSAHTGQA